MYHIGEDDREVRTLHDYQCDHPHHHDNHDHPEHNDQQTTIDVPHCCGKWLSLLATHSTLSYTLHSKLQHNSQQHKLTKQYKSKTQKVKTSR